MPEIAGEFEIPIRQLKMLLDRGGVIGLATDTTYALVARISSRDGVERLRELRNLPPSKPLSVLLKDLTVISRYAFIDRVSYRLMKSLIPGHYTFILRATKELPRLMLTNQRTVGVRICGLPLVDALCDALDEPLVSASAVLPDNGGYAETAEQVADAYPALAAVMDAGQKAPEPSTVIDLTGPTPQILREGSGRVDMVQLV